MAALDDYEEYRWMKNPLLFVPILGAFLIRAVLILLLPRIENRWLNVAIILATYLFCFGATYLVLLVVRRRRKSKQPRGTSASDDVGGGR